MEANSKTLRTHSSHQPHDERNQTGTLSCRCNIHILTSYKLYVDTFIIFFRCCRFFNDTTCRFLSGFTPTHNISCVDVKPVCSSVLIGGLTLSFLNVNRFLFTIQFYVLHTAEGEIRSCRRYQRRHEQPAKHKPDLFLQHWRCFICNLKVKGKIKND